MQKILSLLIFVVLCLTFSTLGQSQTRADLSAEIDKLVLSGSKPDEPGGVVLVAKGAEIVYRRAFGLANVELNVPMREDMLFNIGSMTKQFTAVAILQLAEQGKLSLRDDLTKYVADYPTNGQTITIENLLTHTAGIPTYDPEAMSRLQGQKRLITPAELLSTFKNRPLDFAPGSKFKYSNNGYMLLGLIIEKVSGVSYGEYLQKNLFVPSGMTRTQFGDDYKITKNRAASYVYSRAESQFLNAANDKIETAYAAGGIQSTAEDLLRWNRSLFGNKLVKKESLSLAHTSARLSDGKAPNDNYGYGWFIGNIQGSPTVEHGGNMGGFMSHAIYFPSKEIFVCVLFNFRTPTKLPEFLAGDVAAIAIGKPFRMEEMKLDENVLRLYAGVYEEDGVDRLITAENGKLYYQRVGANKMLMRPYDKAKFFFENTATVGEFTLDKAGKVVALVLSNKRGISSTVLKRTEKPLSVRP